MSQEEGNRPLARLATATRLCAAPTRRTSEAEVSLPSSWPRVPPHISRLARDGAWDAPGEHVPCPRCCPCLVSRYPVMLFLDNTPPMAYRSPRCGSQSLPWSMVWAWWNFHWPHELNSEVRKKIPPEFQLFFPKVRTQAIQPIRNPTRPKQ